MLDKHSFFGAKSDCHKLANQTSITYHAVGTSDGIKILPHYEVFNANGTRKLNANRTRMAHGYIIYSAAPCSIENVAA